MSPEKIEAILKEFANSMDERGFVAEDIKVMCDHLRPILQALTSPQPQTGERA